MMPISYQNIGFTFILIMVVFLTVNEAIRYFKNKPHKPLPKKSHIIKK